MPHQIVMNASLDINILVVSIAWKTSKSQTVLNVTKTFRALIAIRVQRTIFQREIVMFCVSLEMTLEATSHVTLQLVIKYA